MHPLRLLLLITVAAGSLSGCDELGPALPRVHRLPAPPREQPVCNLPAELHIGNWRGKEDQGSCVHASLKNHAAWHNDQEFVQNWPWEDGETATRVRQRLDDAGYEFAFTERYDARFLDWCDATGHGAILWWKPSHCCCFMGWVTIDGVQYAAILDNNHIGHFELTEREQFIRLWSGYGGFALCLLEPPATSLPYRSYELD